jgi:hypothetical protein
LSLIEFNITSLYNKYVIFTGGKMKKSIILLIALFFVSSYSGDLISKDESFSEISMLASSFSQIEKSTIANILEKLPLYFIPNEGQVEERVHYQLKLSDVNIYFLSEEIVYQFFHRMEEKAKVENIRMKFVGMSEEAEVEGGEESEVKVSYFSGNDPEKWIQGAGTYKKIIYRDLYPDIDLIISGREGKIKHEYRVQQGGAVEDIRIKYENVEGLRVNEEGELEIILKEGKLIEGVPISYQIINGKSVKVKSEFKIMEGNGIGFRVGEYKKDRALIIDPELSFSTYLGGSGDDRGNGIAVDGSGNVYVTGLTSSSDFPITFGTYDTSLDGWCDVYITKLNSMGSALSYSTYLGGSGDDYGYKIAVDGSGNVYVAGSTDSTDFPTTPSAYDTSFNGGYSDVFVTKLNPMLSALSYSTYLGGNNDDWIRGMAIDGSGNAYVGGETFSTDFPATPGAYDTSYNGNTDVYITKVNSIGSALSYSTYLGGSDDERGGRGIAIDASGNAYITGYTKSTNFPTTPGAYDTSYNGNTDVFITKVNSIGSALSYSTYLGGSDDERGWGGIAIDGSENIYVTGYTISTNFPTTPGAYDISINGEVDVFITKLNSMGSALSYSTYLGGNDWDYGYGIAVDGRGNACVTGYILSADFPTTPGAYDISYNGGKDLFMTKLNSTGSVLSYSTYLGGSGDDYGDEIVVDGSGNVYVIGRTLSADFPTTPGAYDTSYNGTTDAFVIKFLSISPLPDIKANGSDGPITITRSDTLSITVEFDAGTFEGDEADWWLVAITPLGWYHYDRTFGWLPGREVSLQIPLRDLPSREVLNMSGLPVGSYAFYFGVDLVKNGSIDMDQAFYDSVEVTVNP